MTAVVTRITDVICVRVYLGDEINIMFQPKDGLTLQQMCGGDNSTWL